MDTLSEEFRERLRNEADAREQRETLRDAFEIMSGVANVLRCDAPGPAARAFQAALIVDTVNRKGVPVPTDVAAAARCVRVYVNETVLLPASIRRRQSFVSDGAILRTIIFDRTLTFRKAAAKLGLSFGVVHKRYRSALADIEAECANLLRTTQVLSDNNSKRSSKGSISSWYTDPRVWRYTPPRFWNEYRPKAEPEKTDPEVVGVENAAKPHPWRAPAREPNKLQRVPTQVCTFGSNLPKQTIRAGLDVLVDKFLADGKKIKICQPGKYVSSGNCPTNMRSALNRETECFLHGDHDWDVPFGRATSGDGRDLVAAYTALGIPVDDDASNLQEIAGATDKSFKGDDAPDEDDCDAPDFNND